MPPGVGRGVAPAGQAARLPPRRPGPRRVGRRRDVPPGSGGRRGAARSRRGGRRQHPDPLRRRCGRRPGLGDPGPGVHPCPRLPGQGPHPHHRAGRTRDQGRGAGRAAGARARRRHRAQLRGRAPPRPPLAAGRQAPLRGHRRARPVRDDRPAACAVWPTRAGCSSATGVSVGPARPSSRRWRGTGPCSSNCRP